jgi:hypothetical protein
MARTNAWAPYMGPLNVSAPNGLVLLTMRPSFTVDAVTPTSVAPPVADVVGDADVDPVVPLACVVDAAWSARRVPHDATSAATTSATTPPERRRGRFACLIGWPEPVNTHLRGTRFAVVPSRCRSPR